MLGGGPELVRHCIQFTKIEVASDWVVAVEAERALFSQKSAAQRALQPVQALPRLHQGKFRRPAPSRRPASLNLSDPFDNHGIVSAMRPAMERQAKAHGSSIVRRKQQAIAAKVVKAELTALQRI